MLHILDNLSTIVKQVFSVLFCATVNRGVLMRFIRAVSFPQLTIAWFFLTMAVLVFIGDGKQGMGDVIFSGLLGLVTLGLLCAKSLRPLPSFLHVSWVIFLGFMGIRSLFSDSVGYSLFSFTRLFEAYLVMSLFYSIASKRILVWFVWGLFGFVGSAVMGSLLFSFFPWFGHYLPFMNLLTPVYGHNHLADVLLFVAPLVVGGMYKKQHTFSSLVFIFFTGVLLFTVSRGVWILYAVYLFWTYLSLALKGKSKQAVLIGCVSVLFVAGCIGTTLLPLVPGIAHAPFQILRQFGVKPKATIAGRWEYWRQAMIAIRERPLLGSGPGTFYLDSKRFQSAPRSFSWFAHSMPLEILTEEGLVGGLLFFVLFWGVGQGIFKVYAVQKGQPYDFWYSSLFAGVVLTGVYGLYEFNVNFLVIWILWWASLGILTGFSKEKGAASPLFMSLFSCFLLIFSFSAVGAVVFSVKMHDAQAFYIAPYNVNQTLLYLRQLSQKKEVPPSASVALISLFHGRDPEVRFALATLEARVGKTQEAEKDFEIAIARDPQNLSYYKEFINFLLREKSGKKIGEVIVSLKNASPLGVDSPPPVVDFLSTEITVYYTDSFFGDIEGTQANKEYLSKLYYLLGLSLLKKNPIWTQALWTSARDLSPSWGYFHMELAALQYFVLKDVSAAKKVLEHCQRFVYPASWCRATTLQMLRLPGALEKNIRAIPVILPE